MEPALGFEIEQLTADHAAETGRTGERFHQCDADDRVRRGRLVGEDVEGVGQKRVAREDRGRLIVFLMCGRLAAPEIIVVHRRQVVVDKAVAMHAFDGGGGAQHALPLLAEQTRRLDHQKGTKALAAGQGRVAHALDHPLRSKDFAGQDLRVEQVHEDAVDRLGHIS